MTITVVSTLEGSTRYVENGISVLVKGEACSPSVRCGGSSHLGLRPANRAGIVTEVSDDEARFLSEHKLFQEHKARGFVKIIYPETVAAR